MKIEALDDWGIGGSGEQWSYQGISPKWILKVCILKKR